MAGHLILHRNFPRLHSPLSEPLPGSPVYASPVTDEVLLGLDISASVLKREAQSEKSSSAPAAKSCAPNDSRPECEKPVSANTTTISIVLGVLIPLTVALVLFIVLHRRHVRKLRSEDANDKHKSLDFGMEDVIPGGKKRGANEKRGQTIPEMSLADTEKTLRRGRGLSLDMNVGNPYLLPPELQQSRESLHSLSRTLDNGDDKYRPATTFTPYDGTASRQGSRSRAGDDSSSYTASTRRAFEEKENESNQSLLRHAQKISRSVPPTRRISVTSDGSGLVSHDRDQPNRFPTKVASPVPPTGTLAPMLPEPNRDSFRSDVSQDGHTAGLRKSNDYLGAFIRAGGPAAVEVKAREDNAGVTPPLWKREPTSKVYEAHEAHESPPSRAVIDFEPLKFDFPNFDQPVPTIKMEEPAAEEHTSHVPSKTEPEASSAGTYEQDFDYDIRRLTMGIRPLPPDDPSEDPEQRAIRIRSFYKEYFDDGKHGPVYTPEDYQTGPDGYQYNEPLDGASSAQYINTGAPYAQPIARRAMTPPPRGPSSLQAPGRLAASASGGYSVHGGPRAYSSASGRSGPNRGPPTKKLPPPTPLSILPTPHLLKDDAINSMDFAPPSSIRERRAGTPDSPRGGMRPYSPGLPGRLPLASSFDDLAMMPSPHALRKSGTFTALDFAPPPRFRSNTDSRSDSGSIRSNRSGMSAAQLHSIRAGAYRVSRIPQGLGGTKQEFVDNLRPQWDMRK